MACLHQQICFYITFAILSGKFRVGFGEGDISNTILHELLTTLLGYLNYEPPQYIPEAKLTQKQQNVPIST